MNEGNELLEVKKSDASTLVWAEEALKLNREGIGLTAIARRLGVNRSAVYGVITRARKRSISTK